ncbi:MAG: hypothetical protein ACNYZH_10225 [Acidimicrobiia bacterium]
MTDHLVAYEYGTGQVWGYIRARSSADIESIVPEVEVYSAPPSWMSDGELRLLRERAVYLSGSTLDSIVHRRSSAA